MINVRGGYPVTAALPVRRPMAALCFELTFCKLLSLPSADVRCPRRGSRRVFQDVVDLLAVEAQVGDGVEIR